jgi:probable rRNA maturation factor
MRELILRNRQRARALNLTAFREFTRTLLEDELQLDGYALGIEFVGAKTMAEINWRYLQHEGPTDIITFDHGADAGDGLELHGELFICVPVAEEQAAEFGTRWFEELARYVIHGVLHLRGYDDLQPAPRRVMKREEGRLLKRLGRRFPLSRLGRGPRLRAHEA